MDKSSKSDSYRLNIFDHDDYRVYLQSALDAGRSRLRGIQSRLAEQLGCQSAYVSMVLADRAELSLEQAAAANEFFGHSESEAHYFLLLVQKTRAGTAKLKRYFQDQIAHLRRERHVLAKRLTGTTTLEADQQAVFYSAWYYTATHIALTIPHLQTREALRDYLGLPLEVVNATLEFMVRYGLAVRDGERFIVGPTRLHLDQQSIHAATSHSQMRMRTIASLATPKPDDLHYSSVVSASANDLPKMREIMMRAIEEMRAVIRASPEEDVFMYSLDLLKLRN